MSWKIIDHLWQNTQLQDTELLLMLAIAHHINKRGIAYPSVARLAKFIRRSSRTVKRLIRELEGKGYLQVKYGGGPKGTNVYHICTSVPHDKAMTRGVTSDHELLGDVQTSPEDLTSELSKKEIEVAKRFISPESALFQDVFGHNGTSHD